MKSAIIGCGNIAHVHTEALMSLPDAELTAFCDCVPERAQDFSEKYTGGRAQVFSSIGELLSGSDAEVIHICTPHDLHVPMAVQILRSGRNAFMEKPPAVDRTQFRELKETAEESSGRLGICFQNRYNPATGKILSVLRDGRFGRIEGGRAFVTWNRPAPYYTGSSWKGNWQHEGGGALINQSIHTLDLLLLFMGKPLGVAAAMQNFHLKDTVEVEDTLEACLTFTEGPDPVRAVFYATTAYTTDAPVFLELQTEGGNIRLEGEKVSLISRKTGSAEQFDFHENILTGKGYWGNGHPACIRDFYEAVETGRPYRNDLASTENTFDTMMRIYEAAGRKEESNHG